MKMDGGDDDGDCDCDESCSGGLGGHDNDDDEIEKYSLEMDRMRQHGVICVRWSITSLNKFIF